MVRRLMLAAALVALAGCAAESPVEPVLEGRTTTSAAAERASHRFTVMTQNLYPGFNADIVLGALVSPDQSDDLPALLAAVQQIQHTDFPSRAEALADEIARRRPQAIGLQEVFTIDVDLNAIGQNIVVHQNFLSILSAALVARGLHYTVAAAQQGVNATPFPFMSVTDYDVLLVDADQATYADAQGHNYTYNLGDIAAGVSIKRGWVSANVTVDDRTYLVASAHPESGADWGQLRAAQATELVAALGDASPAVLVGDLNDQAGSALYQIIGAADFVDVWRALRPGVAGLTCCHVDDLDEAVPHFDQRIDFVFARGLEEGNRPVLGQIERIDDRPSDRFPGPDGLLWWSDHAGLVATLLEPAGRR